MHHDERGVSSGNAPWRYFWVMTGVTGGNGYFWKMTRVMSDKAIYTLERVFDLLTHLIIFTDRIIFIQMFGKDVDQIKGQFRNILKF